MANSKIGIALVGAFAMLMSGCGVLYNVKTGVKPTQLSRVNGIDSKDYGIATLFLGARDENLYKNFSRYIKRPGKNRKKIVFYDDNNNVYMYYSGIDGYGYFIGITAESEGVYNKGIDIYPDKVKEYIYSDRFSCVKPICSEYKFKNGIKRNLVYFGNVDNYNPVNIHVIPQKNIQCNKGVCTVVSLRTSTVIKAMKGDSGHLDLHFVRYKKMLDRYNRMVLDYDYENIMNYPISSIEKLIDPNIYVRSLSKASTLNQLNKALKIAKYAGVNIAEKDVKRARNRINFSQEYDTLISRGSIEEIDKVLSNKQALVGVPGHKVKKLRERRSYLAEKRRKSVMASHSIERVSAYYSSNRNDQEVKQLLISMYRESDTSSDRLKAYELSGDTIDLKAAYEKASSLEEKLAAEHALVSSVPIGNLFQLDLVGDGKTENLVANITDLAKIPFMRNVSEGTVGIQYINKKFKLSCKKPLLGTYVVSVEFVQNVYLKLKTNLLKGGFMGALVNSFTKKEQKKYTRQFIVGNTGNCEDTKVVKFSLGEATLSSLGMQIGSKIVDSNIETRFIGVKPL